MTNTFRLGPVSAVLTFVSALSLSAFDGQSSGPPANASGVFRIGEVPAAALSTAPDALARRRAELDALQQILGRTARSGGSTTAGLPPVMNGYLSAFGAIAQGRRVTSQDLTWEDWLQRTGELPPDFNAMPSSAEIPDPLETVVNGRRVRITTAAQWQQQRARIRAGFEQWVVGAAPPPPGNVRAVLVGSKKEGDVEVRDIRLEFGPEHRATLRLQLLIPPGPGPFPVLLTDHPRVRPWVNIAVRRGYIGCIYFAAEATYLGRDDSAQWLDVYPQATWGELARWAWGASRAIDYLETLPAVERTHIAIGGHSRNSKQALVAAAFDDRIAAVVPSRGNAGDSMPFRYDTFPYLAESLEEMVHDMPTIFHPRLRFFTGHEDKLPIDMNLLQAMVAPRGLLFSHAYTEHQGNAFAVEQSYRSTKRVYEFLGQPQRVGLYQQPGEHPADVEDIEVYFDFFDTVFGRTKHPVPEMWIQGYSFDQWKRLSAEIIDPLKYAKRTVGDFTAAATSTTAWQTRRTSILDTLKWAMGVAPPGAVFPPSARPSAPSWWTSEGALGDLLPRPTQGLPASRMAFGDALLGEIYPPADKTFGRGNQPIAPGDKWPVIIWLHPLSYNMGYSRYALWAPALDKGFAVFTFDQIGFGARGGQARGFYERYPHWSLMGKMVNDTRAAIDQVSALRNVDPSRIYLAGASLGAQVALVTAALDDRVKGVLAVAGVTPLRLDRPDDSSEGIRYYSHLHGLLPRFGFFVGHEDRLPIDFDEIMAAVAPRPVHLISPTLDRYYPLANVTRGVEEVNKIYGLLGAAPVQVESPLEFSRFQTSVLKPGFEWLATVDSGRVLEQTPKTKTGGQR